MNCRRTFQLFLIGLLVILLNNAAADHATSAVPFQLSGTDVSGKKVDLATFAGSTVLVSFFTIGCDACSHDLQLMREFYSNNSAKHFVLLAVNLDKDQSDFDSYAQAITISLSKDKRFPMVWRNAANHHDNFGNITTLPTHFVIDGKGKLVFKREGSFQPDDWDNLWLSLPK